MPTGKYAQRRAVFDGSSYPFNLFSEFSSNLGLQENWLLFKSYTEVNAYILRRQCVAT